MKQLKKISAITLVLFILVVTPVIGSSSLSYGAQGGISLSSMMMIDPDEGGGRATALIVGAIAGGYVESPLWSNEQDTMNLKGRSGLQYALLGGGIGGVLNFHYIQIPLLLKLGLPLQMSGESYLVAGLAGGYLLNVTSPELESIDMDSFNRVEIKALAGMGFSTEMGLSLDIRYQIGLNNRACEEGSIPFLLYDSTVSLVASYKIH